MQVEAEKPAEPEPVRCIWCDEPLAECLARLGSTSCHDCRHGVRVHAHGRPAQT